MKDTLTPGTRLGRMVPIGLAVAAVFGCAAGCEQVNRFASKPQPSDDEVVRALREETREEDEGSPEDQEARNMVRKFFKPNRLSGALSSEAAEIERNLGVDR